MQYRRFKVEVGSSVSGFVGLASNSRAQLLFGRGAQVEGKVVPSYNPDFFKVDWGKGVEVYYATGCLDWDLGALEV